jgi:hypothetical protein
MQSGKPCLSRINTKNTYLNMSTLNHDIFCIDFAAPGARRRRRSGGVRMRRARDDAAAEPEAIEIGDRASCR